MRPFKRHSLFDISIVAVVKVVLMVQMTSFYNVDILYAQDETISQYLFLLAAGLILVFTILFLYVIPSLVVLETIDLFIYLLPDKKYPSNFFKTHPLVKRIVVQKLHILHQVFRC